MILLTWQFYWQGHILTAWQYRPHILLLHSLIWSLLTLLYSNEGNQTQGFMCDEWIVFSGALDLLLENQKVRHHIYKKIFYTLKITVKYLVFSLFKYTITYYKCICYYYIIFQSFFLGFCTEIQPRMCWYKCKLFNMTNSNIKLN